MTAQSSWHPLHAYTVPDYLRVAGVLTTGSRASVVRLGARNRVFSVTVDDASAPSSVVKQFEQNDADAMAFDQDRRLLTSVQNIGVTASYVDPAWRVVVTPWAGQPLSDRLRGGEQVDGGLGLAIASLLARVGGSLIRRDEPRKPAVLTWLTSPLCAWDLSPAQLRVVAALRYDNDVMRAASAASDLFAAPPAVTIHGDLKLEHVVLTVDGPRLIDWEFARPGPAGWDQAGLIQSCLAHVVFGAFDFSQQLRAFLASISVGQTIPVEALATLTAVRLWQTAVEWEGRQKEHAAQTGALCELGRKIGAAPAVLTQLLEER